MHVGQIVLYNPPEHDPLYMEDKPMAAIVANVKDSGDVMLTVFDRVGHTFGRVAAAFQITEQVTKEKKKSKK